MGHTVPWRVGKPHQYEFLRTEMRSEEGRRSGVKRQKPRCVKTKRNLFSGRSEKRDGTKRRRMRRGRQAGKVEAVEHKWNISRREDFAEERWAGSGGESSPPSFSRPGKGREEEDALGKSLRPNALARSESEESEATKLGSSSVPHRSEAQVG